MLVIEVLVAPTRASKPTTVVWFEASRPTYFGPNVGSQPPAKLTGG